MSMICDRERVSYFGWVCKIVALHCLAFKTDLNYAGKLIGHINDIVNDVNVT